jgi:hypothetical protein
VREQVQVYGTRHDEDRRGASLPEPELQEVAQAERGRTTIRIREALDVRPKMRKQPPDDYEGRRRAALPELQEAAQAKRA